MTNQADPFYSPVPKQVFVPEGTARHRLELGSAVTESAEYADFTYLNGYVGVTDYWTGTGEAVMTANEFTRRYGYGLVTAGAASSQDLAFPGTDDTRTVADLDAHIKAENANLLTVAFAALPAVGHPLFDGTFRGITTTDDAQHCAVIETPSTTYTVALVA